MAQHFTRRTDISMASTTRTVAVTHGLFESRGKAVRQAGGSLVHGGGTDGRMVPRRAGPTTRLTTPTIAHEDLLLLHIYHRCSINNACGQGIPLRPVQHRYHGPPWDVDGRLRRVGDAGSGVVREGVWEGGGAKGCQSAATGSMGMLDLVSIAYVAFVPSLGTFRFW